MFRDAFKRHRCIIPASGYYEWITKQDGKQPYFISAADGGVLSFAGLTRMYSNVAVYESTAVAAAVTSAKSLL